MSSSWAKRYKNKFMLFKQREVRGSVNLNSPSTIRTKVLNNTQFVYVMKILLHFFFGSQLKIMSGLKLGKHYCDEGKSFMKYFELYTGSAAEICMYYPLYSAWAHL